jgi:hypothetical protein
MSKNSASVSDLRSLNQAIYQLSNEARQLEKSLDKSLDYLQENYSSMIIKSVMPVVQSSGGITGGVLAVLFQNQRLKTSFGRLTDQLFNRVSDGLDYLSEKMEKKSPNQPPDPI